MLVAVQGLGNLLVVAVLVAPAAAARLYAAPRADDGARGRRSARSRGSAASISRTTRASPAGASIAGLLVAGDLLARLAAATSQLRKGRRGRRLESSRMRFLTRKSDMVDAARALPGREQPDPSPDAHEVLGTPLQPPVPRGLETAVFGLGCFWGAERMFWQAPGVYTTAVGYAGGFTPNPTYEEVCSGADRPHRGRARRLRPGEDVATRSC